MYTSLHAHVRLSGLPLLNKDIAIIIIAISNITIVVVVVVTEPSNSLTSVIITLL